MRKTSFKQAFLLIAFGIFLSLILLEFTLRLAGSICLYLQDKHNHLTYQQNEFRILCLGESTTALGGEDSYPSQLEQMLNQKKQAVHFTVINKGIISTTSEYIFHHLDRNLDTYKPDVVILMMGINDKAYLRDFNKSLWLENVKYSIEQLKVYKLFHLILQHLSHRIHPIANKFNYSTISNTTQNDEDYQHVEDFLEAVISKGVERFKDHLALSMLFVKQRQYDQAKQEAQFAQETAISVSSACIDLSRRYRYQGMYQEAQDILEKAAMFKVNYFDLFEQWGELYLVEEKSDLALKAFQEAYEIDHKNPESLLGLARAYNLQDNDNAFVVYMKYLQIKPQDYWIYIEFAQHLKEKRHFDLAKEILTKAIEIDPYYDQAYVSFAQILDEQNLFKEEEAFLLNEINLHPRLKRIDQMLAELYQAQGKNDLARKYFKLNIQNEMPEYCPATLVNYKIILNKILNRGIKVIIMQYPLRDIRILRDNLGQRPGVFYLENKENFNEALAKSNYGKYFKDNFAYNFGHCTREGNKLIAQNLFQLIFNKIESPTIHDSNQN